MKLPTKVLKTFSVDALEWLERVGQRRAAVDQHGAEDKLNKKHLKTSITG